ncbi:hypothetical protein VM57_01405 [Stenotrophomonas maltophilia]|uniref:SURF1-like protein n=1 Tax=Stenotrophomonas maltophilia TaxID=40324 RepID=A0A0F5ZPR8_STEMA|nr:hypothetical protein VM57_01405 [Stenotrophomonas maltophilia]
MAAGGAGNRRCPSATNATWTCCRTRWPPQRHLGYAVQWFGLALTVLVVALVLEWRRRRAAR